MTLCLFECLKAVGLQQHYDRFNSAGVCRAAHLSGLTMEDYPILGIRSMEERTRLFHLVQMAKTLDLESFEYEDDDYNSDGCTDVSAAVDSSSTYGCGASDEDVFGNEDVMCAAVSKLNAASFSKPSCVRRRLDFSDEVINHHQKPEGPVHVYGGHKRNFKVGQDHDESAIPVQLDPKIASVVVCSCRGNDNHGLDVHGLARVNTKSETMERNFMYTSHTRLSPKCVSSNKPKPRPAAVVSKRFLSNKVTECKDRKGISGRETNSNVVSEHMAKAAPVYESKRTAGYNYGLPLSSPPHPNKKQPGDQRISVCVRKRPLTRAECRRGEADVVTTLNGECLVVHESKEAVDLTQYILQHRFYFDQVFGEGSSNEEVYRRTAYPLVQHMLNGGKATCFAYGQTGAGKTHTMLGLSPERPGLYALAVQDIFAHLHTSHAHSPLLVYVSFFEIYCGQLYDLLDHRKRLFAREDGQNVVHIAGLRDVRVDSVGSLLEVISEGTEERTQGMSGANPLSSRSHALLQIQLRSPNQQLAGRMWFVDLAGSERASDTREPDRQSRLEGAEINQSLLALKECIRSLDQEQSHTPFRQSKLTQVLKDSFVGDSMTCMIANISPGHSATEHTLNTLRYADRVKELRGQGGLRGERRGKTAPSPKRNLSNSNNSSSGSSSVCTRGKSPPKKPKLGRQREAFGPATPDARSTTRGTILCSTPKKGSLREETSTRVRKEIGLEQTTPIRGSLGIAVKRERREKAVGRDGRGAADSADHSSGEQHRKDEELHLQDVQRESGFYHREKETQQSTLIGGIEAERWIEQRQLESSRDMYSEVEMRKKKDVQKVNEGEKERERHLRRYHQQLQQFMPSPASSSDHLFPSSTSLSSSTRVSLSSSVSPSSHRHSSSLIHHGLEDVLDAYRARAELRGQLFSNPSEKICLQTGISPSYNRNKGQVHHCDLGGIGEDWSLSLEGTEAEFGQERGRSEKRRSLKATGEAYVRVGQNWRPAGMDRGGERRWAWMASTEQTDRTTGARPAGLEALASYNCDSEVGEELLDASDVPADGVEEQEEADSYALVSSNSLFNQPHQRAPAERPLSPACEPDNTLLTPNKRSHLSVQSKHTTCTSNILPLQRIKAQQGVPSSSRREKEPQFAADASGSAQSATLPLTQNGCKVSDNPSYTQVKAKMSLIAQGETSTDSVSYSMDPLSISLLQVDQQVATASFLRGEQNNTHPLENESGENKGREAQKDRRDVAEDKNVEFHLSLLEIPNAKTNCPPTSDTVTAANHSEQSNDMCFAIYGHCGVGMMKPPIPEVTLVSLQQHECSQRTPTTPLIKAPESSTKPSTSSIQFSGNTGSPSSRNLMTNGATQMPPENGCSVHNKLALSISTAQSDSVLGQLKTSPKQSSNHSNGSHKPVSPTGSKEEEKRTSDLQNKPIVHLSMLEDLYHDQWRVVQAHWEQLEEMETLCHKDGRLLCQQPDMAFKEYVHKLREIMEKKARCVHSMIVQLQPYLTISQSDHLYNQGEDRDNQIT